MAVNWSEFVAGLAHEDYCPVHNGSSRSAATPRVGWYRCVRIDDDAQKLREIVAVNGPSGSRW